MPPIDHPAVTAAIEALLANGIITSSGPQASREFTDGLRRVFAPALVQLVADETERCAKVADNEPELTGDPPPEFQRYAESLRACVRATKKSIAAAIRARGTP